MDETHDMTLAMPFFTDEPEFVFGFEAGQIWEQAKHGETVDSIIHKKNKAQIEMICVHYDYDYVFSDIDIVWIGLEAKPKTDD